MRIISGTRKGMRLAAFKTRLIRPTTDRTKEVIFNVLKDHVTGSFVLDVYAGTGSLGIEALSRGAARAVFVENNTQAQKILLKNLTIADFLDTAEIVKLPAKKAFRKFSESNLKFDLIFADPPYDETVTLETVELVQKHELLADRGWFCLEHHFKITDFKNTEKLILKLQKRQGDSVVSFYQHA